MKYLTLDLYDKFECVGSACPDTCCGGWDIGIDKDSVKTYLSVPGTFGKKLKENMITREDGTASFRLSDKLMCPFLTKENLCEIYQRLGKENMCHTCTFYPRNASPHGDIIFSSMTLSCPEVARMLLEEKEPMQFHFSEDSTDGDSNIPDTDWKLFNTLISALTFSVDLLQRRDLTLSARLRLLILFSDALQKRMDADEDTAPLIELFSSPEYLEQLLPNILAIPQNTNAKLSAFLQLYKNFEKLGQLTFQTSLTKEFHQFVNAQRENSLADAPDIFIHSITAPEHEIQYEQYCIYFLFRHYMEAYKTKTPGTPIAKLIHLLNIHQCFAIPHLQDHDGCIPLSEQIKIFTSIAKTFEHNSVNRVHALYEIYNENNMTDVTFLLSIC